MSLDQQFRKAVSSPLATLSAEDLKPIALAVWHEDYAPNLNNMELHELQKAGYVVDRLMRFNSVSNERKREVGTEKGASVAGKFFFYFFFDESFLRGA